MIVLRTFSKLYGMAGIRMGFAVGRPDLLEKIAPLGGQNSLPITAVAAAKASLLDADLIPSRRKKIAEIRTENLAWLKSQGYACTPSESNCFMLDVKRPGKEVQAALAQKDMYRGSHLAGMAEFAAHHGRHARRDERISEGLHRSDVRLDGRPGSSQAAAPARRAAVHAFVLRQPLASGSFSTRSHRLRISTLIAAMNKSLASNGEAFVCASKRNAGPRRRAGIPRCEARG